VHLLREQPTLQLGSCFDNIVGRYGVAKPVLLAIAVDKQNCGFERPGRGQPDGPEVNAVDAGQNLTLPRRARMSESQWGGSTKICFGYIKSGLRILPRLARTIS